jgi:hypothetical protein
MQKIQTKSDHRKPLLSWTASYLIAGCGHFGSRAVRGLLKKDPNSVITIIDKDSNAFGKISHLPVQTTAHDAVDYLRNLFMIGMDFDYIVPAVPFHLAFEVILAVLRPLGARRVESPRLSGLPNLFAGKGGDLYASFADFLCPEDCPEPVKHCTVTGKKRQKPLYEILRDLQGDFYSRAIRSYQLGPGIGGMKADELTDLIADIKGISAFGRPILISTACRCHGVISALSF